MLAVRTALAIAVATLAGAAQAKVPSSAVGAVFVATNNADGNTIVMYARDADGELHGVGRFPTGGRGQGGLNDPLESQ